MKVSVKEPSWCRQTEKNIIVIKEECKDVNWTELLGQDKIPDFHFRNQKIFLY
jgi:hypothetical protein